MLPDNLGTLKRGRKVFKVRSRNVGLRWNHRINMIISEKVVHECAFECGADRLTFPKPGTVLNHMVERSPKCRTYAQEATLLEWL
jgi:hypothetical protein